MLDLSNINTYSNRTAVDRTGYAFITDKVGGDELVDTSLKAWDKLNEYEAELEKAKEARDKAKTELGAAKGQLQSARDNYASVSAYVSSALRNYNSKNDPTGSARAALRAMRSDAAAQVSSAQSKVNTAQTKFNNAQKKVDDFENGRLNFQRDLMTKLGLDPNLVTRPLLINDPTKKTQEDWVNFEAKNILEEWAQVFKVGFGARDENGVDVKGDDGKQKEVQGKDAIASYMRYGQWSFNELIKQISDQIMKAIARASKGKGFSMTAID